MNLYEYVSSRPTFATDPSGGKKKKCGVKSFVVNWSKGPDADATHPYLRLDISIKFKKDDDYDPACCEYKQNVMTIAKITDGPNKGFSQDTSPMHDDNYSRDDNHGAKDRSLDTFTTDDNPGWMAPLKMDADSVLDYAFTAEQIVYAPGSECCEKNDEVAKRGPHTGTIKGKDPRTYGGVPKKLE
jgi:hypothetical protein